MPRLTVYLLNSGRKTTKKRSMYLGAWNVRTLLDRQGSLRAERRTALIARELARYRIDIAALSETRLAGEGSLTELKGGYTFFWKGKEENEARIHGVGFAIKTTLMRQIPDLPTCINERLMKLRFPLNPHRHVTIICAYAPTLASSDEIKEAFYSDLDHLLKTTPRSDKLFLLGDFNARVGSDFKNWNGVLGHHGIGSMNSNGQRLLSLCAENDLTVTNTIFRQANKYKTTWMHPRTKLWHMIDFVICRKQAVNDVKITKVMRGAECWTDHRLVRSVLSMHITPMHRKKRKVVRPSFNLTKLKKNSQQFADDLDDRLKNHGPITGSTTSKWDQFKTLLKESAMSIIGPRNRSHQDWFDENDELIRKLLKNKQNAYQEWQRDSSSTVKRDRFKLLQRQMQAALRRMQDEWWENKAEEVQKYADNNNSKMLFRAIKEVYGPTKPCTAPLMSSDGITLLKDKRSINERWREHFSTLLNRPSSVDSTALDQIPQKVTVNHLDLPPTAAETRKAITQTSAGKSPGMDGIPAELFKAAGPEAFNTFHAILVSIWEEEDMPSEFKDATIVTLFKNKGSKTDCGNYRGISLLSIAGKILARIILNRLVSDIAEENLPEAQCGFRPNRSTTDMIFTVRQVQEKCVEQNVDLYVTFVDLTKAFDTVNREALWAILTKLGCPNKFVNLIRLFHDNMTGSVLSGGEASQTFNILNGVKQGCVLAPVLFNLFFARVLDHAAKDLKQGVYLKYRLDGSLFDLRRLKAKTKITETVVLEALFADDCALMAHTESDLQLVVNKFAEASRLFGLTISLSKTEVLLQPAPRSATRSPSIFIGGSKLNAVNDFKYLGSIISSNGTLDKEINARISKASQALGRLRVRVLNQHNIRQSTKLKVYKAVVLTTLLYGSETWTWHRKHLNQLEVFHMRCLRSIMGIRWQDKVTNLEVLQKANASSIEALVVKSQLRWTGHVIRMSENRLPKKLLYGELSSGLRKRGRPRKRYKDCLKANLSLVDIPLREMESLAENRADWRELTRRAQDRCEEKRRDTATNARNRRKKRTASPIEPGRFVCPHCQRACRSRIGLHSHLRTHSCD